MEESFLEFIQQYLAFANHESRWVYEVFIIVFLTLILALLVSWFLKRLEHKVEKTVNLWDDAFVSTLKRPLKWLIWITGLSFAASVTARHADSSLLDLAPKLQHVGVIFLFAWFLNSFIRQVEERVMDPQMLKKPMDETTAVAVSKLLRISVIITAVLVTLQSLGYSISGVLAFGGIGGIAVGFAAKDLLANFFGGLMVYLDRPFVVGDWIRSPDKEIEGIVEDIGWRLTVIRTFDKRPLYIPNAVFTQISVENPSRMKNRRIYETIGIRYDDSKKMSEVVERVKVLLEAHDEIDHSQTLIVNFNKFAPSSLDFFIYCFTKTTNWIEFHKVKQDVLLQIIEVIESSGAECAFPTSTLHIPNEISFSNEQR